MVVTMRSGKELQGREEAEKKKNEAETEKANQNLVSSGRNQNRTGLSNENEQMKEQDEVAKDEIVQKEEVRIYQPPVPFPQRLQQSKLDSQYARLLNIFKKLEINISFVEELVQMPHYAKFIKDIINKKRKLD